MLSTSNFAANRANLTVLIVMPLAEQRGGAELSLRHLIEHGRGRGVDWILVFLEDGPSVREFRRLGVKVHLFEAGRLRQPHRTILTVARIARVARSERATLILGWMTKGHLYGSAAALIARTPAIWYEHGTLKPGDRFARLATVFPTRAVITVSRASARAQAAIAPVRRARMVYPGAEVDRFAVEKLATPAHLRSQLGLPAAGPVIGIVGRLQRWKGVHVLLDAFAELRTSHERAHCLVVGGPHELEPDYPAELNRQVASLGLGPAVTFAGLQANVAEWMQAMDVIVHASDGEPFGIVVIEAMALGKPVIAGSEGGPAEIITHGVDGLLVPYGDSVALARALRRYLDDPQFARRVGVAARRRASDFSARQYAENLIDTVQELAG